MVPSSLGKTGMNAKKWGILEAWVGQMLTQVRSLHQKVSVLESEAGGLRRQLENSNREIRGLRERVGALMEERRVVRTKIAGVLKSLSRWSFL